MDKQSIIAAVEKAGLSIRDCKRHFQVIGGISIVNVYYGKKKGFTLYVQGEAKGRKIKTAKDVVLAATAAPQKTNNVAPRKRYSGVKKRKFRQAPFCHWCNKRFFELSEVTADHVVPLSKGGSNGDDNIVIACQECNDRRSNCVTAEEIQSTRRVLKWSDFKIGTKVSAVMGGHWVRTRHGWKWFIGDTYPTPGGEAVTGSIQVDMLCDGCGDTDSVVSLKGQAKCLSCGLLGVTFINGSGGAPESSNFDINWIIPGSAGESENK